LVGGFLGAGKTTAIARLARHFTGQGLRVGLITNDQGDDLVDTALLRSRGFPVEEISGGCFCCRFNSLVEAAKKLTAASRPDIFIAEPVGSCTDLVATVTYPLRRMYGSSFDIAPLSVLIDPIRARRVFGLSEGSRFSDKVRYIFRKQLEEADLILINKRDLLSAAEASELRRVLARDFPGRVVLEISARGGEGLAPWFARLQAERQAFRQVMDVDYDRYADGEARLGWLNATIELDAPSPFDGNAVLRTLAAAIQGRLRVRSAEIAHLKMTLDPASALGELGVVNLVANDFVPELSQELEEPLRAGQLILNLRAEAEPDTLRRAVMDGLAAMARSIRGLQARMGHLEFFKPGRPQPTHRVTTA
jgi:G3E family GTPase